MNDADGRWEPSSTAVADERLLWQLAVGAAGVGAFDWNLVTDLLRWDDRLLELFGLDEQTFGGTIEAFNDSVHPDDRDRVGAALDAAIATCGTYQAEYRIVLPDGRERWVSARGQALPGPDGTAERVVGAAYDTTAVRDGETRVQRVLESMSTAFFQLDPEWRFTYVNTEAQRLLGSIGAELVGANVWELFPAAVGTDFERHYRRAMESGEPVEFEEYYPPPLDQWYEVRAWPAPDGLSVYFLDITARRQAQLQAERAEERRRLVSGITEALVDTLDPETVANRLAPAVAPWGDWSIVTLVDATSSLHERSFRRHLHDVVSWAADPRVRPLVDRYRELRIPNLVDDAFLFRALREGEPVVVPANAAEAIANVLQPGEARQLCHTLAPTAMTVVPLRGRERILGLLTVFRTGDHPFTDDDVDDLVDAGARAGLALDNARLYAEQRDLAEGLQRSLLTDPPEPDGLEVVVRYEPAAESAHVGGDWYDAFLQDDGTTNVVIGDVMGHDTAAAAAMAQIRSLLRGIAVTTGEGPAQVLSRVDTTMRTLQVRTTATAIVARVEQREAGATLRWSNAGHPPPLIATRQPDGTVEVEARWTDARHLLLGIEPGIGRTEAELDLPVGSIVLLCTDGLIERRGRELADGVEELRDLLAELAATHLTLDELCDEVLLRLRPEQPEDDVALVALKVRSRR